MGLIKSRPKVRVRVPSEIRPGDVFRATIELDCRRPVGVDFVDVTLTGREGWSVGSGKSSVSRRQILVRLGSRLCEERELPAGKTELAVQIPLPAEAPPSYQGTAARIDYELEVHVSIPWWPDRRAAFEIKVAPAPRPSPPTEPRVFTSDTRGPRGEQPHAEMSLSAQWTRVGDVVQGAFALENTAHNRYSEVTAGLVGTEVLYANGRRYGQREYLRYVVRLGAEGARDGEMMHFRFRLPQDAMPDLPRLPRPGSLGGLVSLAWHFELRVGIRWGRDVVLTVPFAVLPASPRPTDAPSRLAPPSVGSDRLRQLWTEVGQPLGLRYEGQRLLTRVGESEVQIRRDHLGRDGIHLVLEIDYPPLHLDLEVEPASKVQRLVGGGKEIGVSGWDRDHYVRARDEGQVAQVLRQLVPRIENTRLRRMDDTRLILQLRDSGQSRTRLDRFARGALAVAQLFEQLRTSLPPPPALEEVVDEWERLAGAIAGELETARMRIAGQLSTMSAEVRVSFDEEGQPLHTWLSVQPTSPIDDEHALTLRAGDEDPAGTIARRFEGEAAELLKIAAHGAAEVTVAPDRLAVSLPAPLGLEASPPWIEISEQPPPSKLTAAAVEQRLGRLARLAALLRGQAGPYR